MHPLFLTPEEIKKFSHVERKNYSNRLKLIKSVIENQGRTMADLCIDLQISKPTVNGLVQNLIEKGLLVQEERKHSAGGRKPMLHQLKSGTMHVLCIEIERFKIVMSVVDNHQQVLNKQIEEFSLTRNREAAEHLILKVKCFIASLAPNTYTLVAVGISMPGLINSREGTNQTYLNDELRDGITINQLLSNALDLPSFVFNDIKTATIAELKFGLAKDKKDVLVIMMDWGIGMGIVLDGELRAGKKGYSGEVGHIPFVDEGALCYCGKKGCLETVASGIALARMVKEGIQSGQDSLLKKMAHTEINRIEPQLVINAAKQGDQYAINCLAYIGEKLGKGIATLLQLFNPELIILAGKMALAKEYITIPMQQAINTFSMQPIRDEVQVQLTQLGTHAGAIGITSQSLERIITEHLKEIEKKATPPI